MFYLHRWHTQTAWHEVAKSSVVGIAGLGLRDRAFPTVRSDAIATGFPIAFNYRFRRNNGLGCDGPVASNAFKFCSISAATVFSFSYRTWVFHRIALLRPPSTGAAMRRTRPCGRESATAGED